MPYITSAAYAKTGRKPIDVHGQTYHLSPYVGSAPLRGSYTPGNEKNDDGLPQGFLVEQPPNSITPPHFHDHEQFQVFVNGSGHIGKEIAQPLALHYARGHTPYGPIAAGPEGIVYFTLRARWDSGAKYMPGARDKLKKVKRKHRMAAKIILPSPDEMFARSEVDRTEVMSLDADGTCAYLFSIPAGEVAVLETPTGAGGQYAIVVGGSAEDEEDELRRLSGFYRYGKEDALKIKAGDKGLCVIFIHFYNNDPV